ISASFEPGTVSRLNGTRYFYTADLPPGRFFRLRPGAGPPLPPEADDYLLWPAQDGALLLLGEQIPPFLALDAARAMEAVNSVVRGQLESYEVVGVEAMELPGGHAVLMHSRFSAGGYRLERLHGFYPSTGQMVQVLLTAREAVFPRLEGDLRTVLMS